MTEQLPSTRLLTHDAPIILGQEDVAELLTEIMWYQQSNMALTLLILDYGKLGMDYMTGVKEAVQRANERVEALKELNPWLLIDRDNDA